MGQNRNGTRILRDENSLLLGNKMPLGRHHWCAVATPDQVIEREDACASGNDQEKRYGPETMRHIGVRIDEDLDHERHAEEGERCKARAEPDDEQNRADMLQCHGHIGGQHRRDQRYAVFLGEQVVLLCHRM